MPRIARGVTAIKQMAEQRKAEFTGGGYTRNFQMEVGEKGVVIRFWGDFENKQDPVSAVKHFCNNLPNGKKDCWCTNESTCIDCYLKKVGGRKDVSSGMRYVFFVQDYRPVHEHDEKVTVNVPAIGKKKAKSYETRYPPCGKRGNPLAPCPDCLKKVPVADAGFVMFDLPESEGIKIIDELIPRARTFCGQCHTPQEDGNGTIVVAGYMCSNPECRVEIGDFNPFTENPVYKCPYCAHEDVPAEIVACSACESPETFRLDLTYFKVRVAKTSSGASQSISWGFDLIIPIKIPDEAEMQRYEERKPDWEKLLETKTPEARAADYGIPSPFAPTEGHGAQSYEETASQHTGGEPDGDVNYFAEDPQPEPARPAYRPPVASGMAKAPPPVQRVAAPPPRLAAAPPSRPAAAPPPQRAGFGFKLPGRRLASRGVSAQTDTATGVQGGARRLPCFPPDNFTPDVAF